jgi:type IV pilus assembly protein PilQ
MGMIKLPIFARSTVETEVVVRSGETVVMGGLVTSLKSKDKAGVPILSKIPLIGRLFRHDVTKEETQNLLIFVTATLISDTGEELIPLAPPEPVTGGGKVELGGK